MTTTHDAPRTTGQAQPDLVVEVAAFAAGLRPDELADDVRAAAKANILDTLSCLLAGSSAPAVDVVTGLVQEWGGAEQADLFVFGGKYPAHQAAWANSVMAHARDYDDTHDAAILHAGVSVVPAALAAAQLRAVAGAPVSGEELIAAVAAGLEVTCRLGVAVEVDIIESGFIYSSLLGYFGATAAAGRALNLTRQEMHNAFGIVFSSVAGNHQVTRDASLMKRVQPGLAAQAAVVAVQLAKRGIRGVQNVFQGADGFFRIYLQDRVDPEVVRSELGRRFEFLNLSYKPYPCCRDTHAAIDAALVLSKRSGRPASEIAEIAVGVTAPGYQMVCVPEEVRRSPKTIVEAQFSIPYTVAAAWVQGPPKIGNFSDEGILDPEVLALAERVRPYVDNEIDREWGRFVTPARVVVTFADGDTMETRVDFPKGHPNAAMSAAEFAAKTADCATFAAVEMASDTPERLTALVQDLENVVDIDELIQVMA